LLSRNPDLDVDLVLAGPLGWNCDDVVAAAAEAAPRGRIVLTGALEDRELAALLRGATLTVIPSLYEGFCLPMVESMACGVPTIASNISCLPEVSGNVLRYFDPLQIEDMVVCMQRVLEDDALRAELSRRGKERAASFDWERCAEETLAVL